MFSSFSRRFGYPTLSGTPASFSEGNRSQDQNIISPTLEPSDPPSSANARLNGPYKQSWQNSAPTPTLSHTQSPCVMASPYTGRQSLVDMPKYARQRRTFRPDKYGRPDLADRHPRQNSNTIDPRRNRGPDLSCPQDRHHHQKLYTSDAEQHRPQSFLNIKQNNTTSRQARGPARIVRKATTHRISTTRAALPDSWHQSQDYSTNRYVDIRAVASRLDTGAEAARYHYSQRRAQARQLAQKDLGEKAPEARGDGEVNYGLMREAAGKAAEERREMERKRGRPFMRRKFAGVGKLPG